MNLYIASMILVPNIIHAYFQSKGEESHFLRAGYKLSWSKNENTFVLYDNFNSGRIDVDFSDNLPEKFHATVPAWNENTGTYNKNG